MVHVASKNEKARFKQAVWCYGVVDSSPLLGYLKSE